jgi:nucleotide-binding universal stress UspA family protein
MMHRNRRKICDIPYWRRGINKVTLIVPSEKNMLSVLIPVDGSDCSDRAVTYFVRHASLLRDVPEIHLLHVHAPIPVGRVQQHIDHATLETYYREEGEALLVSAEALLSNAGLKFSSHIHVGSAAEIIVKLARDLGCDIVFMGTHGRGALPAAMLGSVASKVIHLADRPVMLSK